MAISLSDYANADARPTTTRCADKVLRPVSVPYCMLMVQLRCACAALNSDDILCVFASMFYAQPKHRSSVCANCIMFNRPDFLLPANVAATSCTLQVGTNVATHQHRASVRFTNVVRAVHIRGADVRMSAVVN